MFYDELFYTIKNERKIGVLLEYNEEGYFDLII